MYQTAALRLLLQFRTDLYDSFDRRADALLELGDAQLAAGPVPAPVRLNLAPPPARGWDSLYAALRHGDSEREELFARWHGCRWLAARRSTRWTAAPGHGATPRPALNVASPTIPAGIRRASPSWPAGRSSGSSSSASAP
jgi:hypothetical protein